MVDQNFRLLYLIEESWPTHRADVAVLFGKYLSRYGITVDLVTERDANSSKHSWAGGKELLFTVPKGSITRHFVKSWYLLRAMLTCKVDDYDAIQVRDMAIIGLLGLIIAKVRGITFFYWLSYPQSEGQLLRAKARGSRAGLRYILPLCQGLLGKYVLYLWVLRYADHVFVQSDWMRADIVTHGIPLEKITPVPMGVDLEVARQEDIKIIDDPRIENKRVIVYLGTLDRAREIEKLFEMLRLALLECPDILLVLVGDTEDTDHRLWLEQRAKELEVFESTLWTNWVTTDIAWRYVRAAEVGVSITPRSFLLDCSSPTKVIEYLALGVRVLANDNPDQEKIVKESKSGVCLPYTPETFSSALLQLLNTRDVAAKEQMTKDGISYVSQYRSYDKLASELAGKYQLILAKEALK